MLLAKVCRHLQVMLSGGKRKDDYSDWEVYWKINMKVLARTSAWAFEGCSVTEENKPQDLGIDLELRSPR